LLVLPRPLFWIPRRVIRTVIRRHADRRRHATVPDLVELPSPTWSVRSTGFVNSGVVSQVGWFQAGGTFQWQGSVVLWFVVEKQNPAPALTIIIIIITWHASALGNQTATISCVAIAEWPPSLVCSSPSRFIASSDSNVSHREGGCRAGMLLLSPCGVPINPRFTRRAGAGVLAALISASPSPGIPIVVSRE
jgi:hypothetical protein